MASDEIATTSGVRAAINYIRNPVAPGDSALTFVTEQDELSTMITTPGREMWIEDMRGQKPELDREGFQLVRHASSVPDLHRIEEDAAIDRLYIEEMTALTKDVTGASAVFMQGIGKKRYAPAAAERLVGLTNALPALYPHGDTTDQSALKLAQTILEHVPGMELRDFSRWAHFNLWRPITPPPQDYPLALCDARSLAEADKESVIAHSVTRTVGTLVFETTGYLHNPDHRWCYFPDMTLDQVLVFVTHDSDPSRPHQVAHSAFRDPACPADAPPRGSVEIRALALFD
jgi:hypothetical protein